MAVKVPLVIQQVVDYRKRGAGGAGGAQACTRLCYTGVIHIPVPPRVTPSSGLGT